MKTLQIDWHRLEVGSHRLPCPACDKGGKDTALSLTAGADGAVWNCFRCGWAGAERTGRQATTRTAMPARQKASSGHHETLSRQWADYYCGLQRLPGTLGETYLHSRGCVIPPADSALRFDPAAFHWPSQSKLSAIVALMTDFEDASIWRSLHFTFLAADGSGKANVERPKLLLAKHRKAGAVIRLWPDDAVTDGFAVAEGIESALSAAHIFTPIWATGDAGNMAALVVLDGMESITVFADHDEAGLNAAHELADRWRLAGRAARVLRPREHGTDANDVVRMAA